MRIAFDSSPLVRPYPSGVARACAGLLAALRELPNTDMLELAPQPGENERRWRQLQLPAQAQQAGACGVHSPISAFAVCGPGRRVSTVHELPWLNSCTENAGPGHRLWARLAVARADAVICPTNFVREQLVHDSGGGLHIHACHWGVAASENQPTTERDRFLNKHGLDQAAFCLALGANRSKKNLEVILRTMANPVGARELDSLHLVITGQQSADLQRDLEIAESLGIRHRVHPLGYVEEQERQWLSAAARFSVVLSHSEGFGFPVLESLAQGRPVVVTNNSAQAEIAGEYGLTADPRNLESVTAAMLLALDFDSSQSARLRERAQQFTWKRCANAVRNIWGAWE